MERVGIPSKSYMKVKQWFESQTAGIPRAPADGSSRSSRRPAAGPFSDVRRNPQRQGI